MDKETKDSALSPGQESLGQLLRSRVQSFQAVDTPASAPGTKNFCGECGSPLSESSAFCFMCGASKQQAVSHAGSPAAALRSSSATGPADPVGTRANVTPISAPSAAWQAYSPGSYSPLATAATPVFDAQPGTAQEPWRTTEKAPLEDFYPKHDADEDDESERANRFDYRLVVVPLLLALVIWMGYGQRNNVKALVWAAKSALDRQLASVTAKPATPPVKQATSLPARRSQAKLRTVPVRRNAVKRTDLVGTRFEYTVDAFPPSVMEVKVVGQPGPELGRVVPNDSPAAFVGDYEGPRLASTPPLPFRVSIAPRESLALLLKQVPPVYPPMARAARVEGAVVLKAVIKKDGNVGPLSVLSGDALLTQSAMDAVKQWVYRPYYRHGVPVDVETLVIVEFSLAGNRDTQTGNHRGGSKM